MFGRLNLRSNEDRLSPGDRAGLSARNLAVTMLGGVLKERRPFDEVLERTAQDEAFEGMPARDRAFARAIAMAGLRRAGQIRPIIAKFIEKPLPPKRGRLDEILLAAAAQLIFLKSPAHAVINLAVHQVRQDLEASRFYRLANAVLRRISEQGERLAAEQDAARLNTPAWLWTSWLETYGADQTHAIAAQHLAEPPLDLTVKTNPEEWAHRLGGHMLPNGSVRLKAGGRVDERDGFAEGAWWVQDAAAALPAQLLGDIAGKYVADLCAAPGGKTAQLANAGAKVWAVDVSAQRLARLGANLARLGLEARLEEADATEWMPPQLLDAVLLDAPCTATGTIRRNSDIPYIKTAGDIEHLTRLQHRLLGHALDMLRPGGTLVYCTCSLQPEEGAEQIARILQERGDAVFAPLSPDEIAGRGDWLDAQGALRTLPHYLKLSDPDLSGMDGFYAARLVKQA